MVGVGATWEIDVFGRIRRSVESADASLQASIEDYRDVLVSLYAQVAITYVEVRTLRGTVSLRIPPGTSSDAWLRLRGQGVGGPGDPGDHLVRVVVTVPRDVPATVADALRDL